MGQQYDELMTNKKTLKANYFTEIDLLTPEVVFD